MKMRTLLIVSMSMLSLAAPLYAADPGPLETLPAPAEYTQAPPESAREMKVFAFDYQEAGRLAETIRVLAPRHEATIAVDLVANHLIVATAPDRMQQIERVIRALDVPPAGEANFPQMMYRIYMLEPPAKHLGLRPFSIVVTGSSQLPPGQILNAGNRSQMQIEKFRQFPRNNEWQFSIAGRAASNEAIERLTEKISDCQVTELEWEDDMPVMPTTQVAPLPKSLQEHIGKFLGEGTGIVGYWFGNLSVPGTVRAPIGPWAFDMSVERSTQENEVELEITVVRESPPDTDQTWQILSNSIRGKIGQPTIIGYNRDNRGVQTMGALVIVPEDM